MTLAGALINQINPAFNRGDVNRTISAFAENRTFLMAQARPETRRVHRRPPREGIRPTGYHTSPQTW